jgi:hypothetical protein
MLVLSHKGRLCMSCSQVFKDLNIFSVACTYVVEAVSHKGEDETKQ